MSYYYNTNQHNQEDYTGQSDFGPYSYPPPVHLPPPNIAPDFFSLPPPGQFYTPNVNNFQPQSYAPNSECTRTEPYSTERFSSYDKNEGRSKQGWRHPPQNNYQSHVGRGQGYKRGNNQGYRGGHKSGGHEKDYRQDHERYKDQRYQRNVGDGFDRKSGPGYGKGRGYERGQGHGYERGQKHGSNQEQDSKQKLEGSGGKNDRGASKSDDSNSNMHRERLSDSQSSVRSSGSDGRSKEKSDSKQKNYEGDHRESPIESQGPGSIAVERKSKTYNSDHDFLEKNFASFTKKSSNKPSVAEQDGNMKSQRGHSEKCKSGHQPSDHSEKPKSGKQHSPKDNYSERPKSGKQPSHDNYSERPKSGKQPSHNDNYSERPKSGKQPSHNDNYSERPHGGKQPSHNDNYSERPQKVGKLPSHNDDYTDRPPKSGNRQSRPNQYQSDDHRAGKNPRNRHNAEYGRNWHNDDYYTDKRQSSKKDNSLNQKNSPRENVKKSENRKETSHHHEESGERRVGSGSRVEKLSQTAERERKDSDRDSVYSKDSSTNENDDRQISELSADWAEALSERSGSRTVSESQSEASDDLTGDPRPKHEKKDKTIHYKPMRKQNTPYHHQQQQHHHKGHGKGKPPVVRTASGRVDESQRALLIEQLTMGTYECMVCCDTIRAQSSVWSCSGCYHIFHLRCIKTWAKSPTAKVEGLDHGWRCPACQNTADKIPTQYRCFCGKMRDPEWNRMETPHSCGEVCKKNRSANCKHHCNILCHPGPCPPCNAVVPRQCLCGKKSQSVKCSSVEVFQCSSVCQRQLNCGKHFCTEVCHAGPCEPCKVVVKQECYGGHETREVTCGSSESFIDSYSCDEMCDKKLACGNHVCEEICHQGPCPACLLLPEAIHTCPCGARELTDLSATPRQTCLDPIPTCGGKCGKKLKCGPPKKPHVCERKCHEGPCGSCDLTTELTCRCTKFKKEFPCTEVMKLKDRVFLCERKCNKLRACQRHKCGQHCCVTEEHACNLICGKKLPCGLHKCDEPCHRGNCPTCLMASFDELTCHCGAEIMYPPIPCGAKPPECKQICNRVHTCDHEVQHRCHSEENCPPCTALTEKWCMGMHEMRRNIACHRDSISCGLPCNKDLPCQQHKCTKVCHSGPCQAEGEKCKQPCQLKRSTCDHLCMSECHAGKPCPPVPCKAEVKIKCACGHKEAMVTCQSLDSKEFKSSRTMQNLASSLGAGQSVDISHLTSSKKSKKSVLECDSECALIERNRRLALALEIKNPDLGNKLGTPSFSDFLKDFAKKNLHFVASVEKNFNDLVVNAKKAKQAYRSHSFPSMNRDQRRLIHELAECYGCDTQSYDYEPNKNVVATAHKEKCWLPNVTLTSYVQRETHPMAPVPIPHRYNETALRETAMAAKHSFDVLKDKPIERVKRSNDFKDANSTSNPASKVIDYFDFSTK